MGPDDRLKQFKTIAGNYDKYQNYVKSVDEKILLVEHKMENVHSIDFEKPTGTGNSGDRPMIELIEKKTALEKEKQYYLDLIAWTEKVIGSFDSGAIKALIWMSCVKRRSLSSVADEYNMSRDYLYKIRRAYLLRALNEGIMDELEHICKSSPVPREQE